MAARFFFMLLFGLALSGAGPSVRLGAAESPEYLLKATWVYNFIKYCEWPARNADEPIVIGILGEDPFGESMDKVTRGKTIENRPLVIKRSRLLDDLGKAQVIFVSSSEKDRLGAILPGLRTLPCLTISDAPGFAVSGGIISLWVESDSVRFHVNPQAAQEAGLRVRAQLLKLSKEPPPRQHQTPTP